MDARTPRQKRLRLTIALAALGFLIAAAFAIFAQIVDPRPASYAAVSCEVASLILCPGSLLFVTFIDAEPGTSGFVFMWVTVGLVNAGLYGAIGAIIGRLTWGRDN
jgi:hypothetical protein